jgi:hypothetical protein
MTNRSKDTGKSRGSDRVVVRRSAPRGGGRVARRRAATVWGGILPGLLAVVCTVALGHGVRHFGHRHLIDGREVAHRHAHAGPHGHDHDTAKTEVAGHGRESHADRAHGHHHDEHEHAAAADRVYVHEPTGHGADGSPAVPYEPDRDDGTYRSTEGLAVTLSHQAPQLASPGAVAEVLAAITPRCCSADTPPGRSRGPPSLLS